MTVIRSASTRGGHEHYPLMLSFVGSNTFECGGSVWNGANQLGCAGPHVQSKGTAGRDGVDLALGLAHRV